ncbi:hypothetical protein QTL96_14035 [Rhizobium sp. S163]|nr:hypothetical protein [Rhizobium sp. S163]
MPIYYFHLVGKDRAGNETRVEDPEGTNCADLSGVREEAVANARELMANAIRQGRDISSRSIEVRDTDCHIVLTLPFHQAISGSG